MRAEKRIDSFYLVCTDIRFFSSYRLRASVMAPFWALLLAVRKCIFSAEPEPTSSTYFPLFSVILIKAEYPREYFCCSSTVHFIEGEEMAVSHYWREEINGWVWDSIPFAYVVFYQLFYLWWPRILAKYPVCFLNNIMRSHVSNSGFRKQRKNGVSHLLLNSSLLTVLFESFTFKSDSHRDFSS